MAQRVFALSYAQLAEVFAGCAGFAHVVMGQQSKAGVGTAGAVRIDPVLRKARELADGLAKRVDMVSVA